MFVVLILLLAQAPATPNIFERYVEAQKAFSANPKSEANVVALVSILYENGQTDTAVSLLQPFVKANPKASRARLFLALGYARQEKYEQARALAAQIAGELPSDYYAHHILGLSLAGLNQFDKAAAEFQKAISLKTDFADSHYELGVLDARNGETLEQARKEFLRALEIGYTHPEIYKNLAAVSAKLGQYDEAIADSRKAIEMDPDYADAYFQLADALRKSGKVDEAAAATEKFQSLSTANVERKQKEIQAQDLYKQGMSLLEKDDLQNAYRAFRGASDLSPKLDVAYYRMAQLEYLADDSRRALDNIRRALSLNPVEAEYYFVLARCLESSDVAGAIAAANKAVELHSSVADFHNLLGNLLEKSGDHVKAVASYRRAVELDPKNDDYRLNLAAAQRRLPVKK